jgi:hypothetical protein
VENPQNPIRSHIKYMTIEIEAKETRKLYKVGSNIKVEHNIMLVHE